MRREAVAQGVQRDALGQPRRLDRRPAGRMQHGRVDRMIVVAAGEQERLRAGEAPVRAQDAQQGERTQERGSKSIVSPPPPLRPTPRGSPPRPLSKSATLSPATSEA